MFPCICINGGKAPQGGSWRKRTNKVNAQTDDGDVQPQPQPQRQRQPQPHVPHTLPFGTYSLNTTKTFSLRAHAPPSLRNGGIKNKMASKVSNFSDLIQRVTASCLLHPLSAGRHDADGISDGRTGDDSEYDKYKTTHGEDDDEEEYEEDEDDDLGVGDDGAKAERVMEMEMLMGEVFEAVSAMKRAYVSLQEAHCPWDPDKMRVADMAVVAELRRLGVLRERFRRSIGGGEVGRARWRPVGAATLREVVAPYEATVDELKREVKCKQAEIDGLKEQLKTAVKVGAAGGGAAKKGRSHHSKRNVNCTKHVNTTPATELFEATMSSVKEASKSFTSLLLSLMRSAHWDIRAAVRSIEAATANAALQPTTDSIAGTNHAKYALESYVCRKIFQGFDHETFYMDGSLSSLLNPDQYRRDCFSQYRDMRAMDPTELLGILPTCAFGNFCSKKFLSIVHPKMEESLFGDLEQRRQVLAGNHPRSRFYSEFLGLAKVIWLLHLLAFSMDPPPSHFEVSRGADFHPQYMESVVKVSGAKTGLSLAVGFPVSPGFKLGNGSIVKARVYLIPKNGF